MSAVIISCQVDLQSFETCDPDLALSINLGYSPHNGNTPGIERFSRRKRSRKFQMHQQQAEID